VSERDESLLLAALTGKPEGAPVDPAERAAAERVMEALGTAPLPAGPTPAAMQRSLDAVMAEWDAPSWSARLRAFLFPAAVVAASVALAFVLVRPEGTVAFATWHCAPAEMLFGLLPFAVAVMAHRRKGGRVSALSMGGWAAAGALVGQVAMLRLCFGRDLEHLMVFHVGGVLAAALVGALVSRPIAWLFARS